MGAAPQRIWIPKGRREGRSRPPLDGQRTASCDGTARMPGTGGAVALACRCSHGSGEGGTTLAGGWGCIGRVFRWASAEAVRVEAGIWNNISNKGKDDDLIFLLCGKKKELTENGANPVPLSPAG